MENALKRFAGVDTHKDTHALCVLDGLGRKVFEGDFPADAKGYRALAEAIGSPEGCAAVGVEGTSTYGAGLARELLDEGYVVVEVLRPKRARRRKGSNKNDFADAERAARDVASGAAACVPKAKDGWVEAARLLLAARRQAVRTATASMNSAKSILGSAPEEVRCRFKGMGSREMMASLSRKRTSPDPVVDALYKSLRVLAQMWRSCTEQAADLKQDVTVLVAANAPALLAMAGSGGITAAILAVAAGDNPERMRSEAAFAALCGASPVEASSGRVCRHRLNQGGNRQANYALGCIASLRMRFDARTRAYVEKRTAEGKTKREIKRCLKRYIAREAYHALANPEIAPERRGDELREIRLSLRLTQAEAGARLGVPSARISEIERNARQLPELEAAYRSYLEKMIEERPKRKEKGLKYA